MMAPKTKRERCSPVMATSTVVPTLPPIGIVVPGAGISARIPAEDYPDADLERMIEARDHEFVGVEAEGEGALVDPQPEQKVAAAK